MPTGELFMEDKKTVSYFDENLILYENWRFDPAIKFINQNANEDSSLIDIGCGIGNVLKYISDTTHLKNLNGIDVSPQCLQETREKIKCTTHLGSILDNHFIDNIKGNYDFVVLGAVLHHLVGSTRRASRRMAIWGIQNSLRLLKEGGHLIILEPTFSPSFMMAVVFWIKKIITKITPKRIEFFAELNNIGAPVVSFYTNDQLGQMINDAGDSKIVETASHARTITKLMRIALIRESAETTFIIQKTSN